MAVTYGTYTSTGNVNFADSFLTSHLDIYGLVEGPYWGTQGVGVGGVTISYSMPTLGSWWDSTWYSVTSSNSPNHNEPGPGFSALNVSQQAAVTTSLQLYSHVANINFQLVTENNTDTGPVGDIRVANTTGGQMDPGTYAYTWVHGNSSENGDVWINSNFSGLPSSASNFALGGGGFNTVIHELGHAIGLDHPFSIIAFQANGSLDAFDTFQYTNMSYSPATNMIDDGSESIYPTTPMLLDIQALQYLYGANTTYANGNDLYSFSEGQNYYQTIYDTGGIDTISYSSVSDSSLIDLRGGYNFSQLGNAVTFQGYNSSFQPIGLQSNPNDVTIYFGQTIEDAIGGGGADTIVGNDAANLLIGNGGSDSILGGLGNDTETGNSGFDYLDGGAGDDSLLGGQGNDTLLGGDGNDLLKGDIANDYVDGGIGDDTIFGGQGADSLNGGDGNDRVSGDNGNDTLNGGLGNDTLLGVAGDDQLFGNSGFDSLVGGDGNDLLRGGQGSDNLDGGLGNDSLFGDIGNDFLVGGAGDDTLFGGQGSDNLDGGDGNDYIRGDAAIDALTGGLGNDNFVFANAATAGDTVTDFVTAVDHITLLASGFSQLVGQGSGLGGSLAAGDFVSGAGAVAGDTNDFIIYDTSNGHLWFDADGNGSGGASLIATLTNLASLSATDIFIG